LLVVHLFIIAYNLGHAFGVSTFASIITGILFILVGNIIPRLPQGSMQWPKLPEADIRKVSRFQGRFMMIIGFAFVLLSLLPDEYIVPAFFLLLTIFILVLIGGTIRYTRSSP